MVLDSMSSGRATIAGVVEHTGLSHATVYAALRLLTQHGHVAATHGSTRHHPHIYTLTSLDGARAHVAVLSNRGTGAKSTLLDSAWPVTSASVAAWSTHGLADH